MVKVYEQRHRVHYADYRVGFWYINPFELRTVLGKSLILSLLPLPDQAADSKECRKETLLDDMDAPQPCIHSIDVNCKCGKC